MAVQGEEAHHALKVTSFLQEVDKVHVHLVYSEHQVKMAALCEVERPTLLAMVNTCTLMQLSLRHSEGSNFVSRSHPPIARQRTWNG